jgi:hypothetical protein
MCPTITMRLEYGLMDGAEVSAIAVSLPYPMPVPIAIPKPIAVLLVQLSGISVVGLRAQHILRARKSRAW